LLHYLLLGFCKVLIICSYLCGAFCETKIYQLLGTGLLCTFKVLNNSCFSYLIGWKDNSNHIRDFRQNSWVINFLNSYAILSIVVLVLRVPKLLHIYFGDCTNVFCSTVHCAIHQEVVHFFPSHLFLISDINAPTMMRLYN
jgi:hypothetical protein